MNPNMIRRAGLLVIALVIVLCALAGTGIGTARADPDQSGTTSDVSTTSNDQSSGDPAPPPSGQQLPPGFPANLKKYVAGTDEFKKGEWFSGPCAAKGGDFAKYFAEMAPNEDRLMYWMMPAADRVSYVENIQKNGSRELKKPTGGTTTSAKEAVEAGYVPPEGSYPLVFPGNSTDFYPSREPTCAKDMARWSGQSLTTWGFEFAKQPDDTSLAAMKKVFDTDKYTNPCQSSTTTESTAKLEVNYCSHAMFLNCDAATAQRSDARRCITWNLGVAHMFKGISDWIDDNKSVGTRALEASKWLLDHNLVAQATMQLGKAYASAFSSIWQSTVGAVVDFVKDAKNVIGEWANAFKKAVVTMTPKVIRGLAGVGSFDVTAAWFLKWYALATGIGIAVMALMTLLAVWRSASRKTPAGELARDVLGYMPTGIMMMMYTPLVAAMILALFDALAKVIADKMGGDVDAMVNNVSAVLNGLNEDTLVGGAIMGLFLFAVLFIGVIAVFFGLVMHSLALPLTGVAAGIGYGMWVHPEWRKKAIRPVYMFLGIGASKPLLFFLLGVLFATVNAVIGDYSGQADMKTLYQVSVLAVGFMLVGMAPWALVKYAPLLPTRADSEAFGHGGSIGAGALGGAGSAAMMMAGNRGGYSTGSASSNAAHTASQNSTSSSGAAPGSNNGSHAKGTGTATASGMPHAGSGGGGGGSRHTKSGGGVASVASRLSHSKAVTLAGGTATAGGAIAAQMGLAAAQSGATKMQAEARDAAPTSDGPS